MNVPKKLNLGAGGQRIDGYTNIDIQEGIKAYPLNYPDDSVDEIRASHLLEHYGHQEVFKVLRDWVRVLKPHGILKIAIPSFDWIVKNYQSSNPDNRIALYLFGGQSDQYDYHKSVFTEKGLGSLMEQAGLVNIQTWKSEIQDCAAMDVSFNLQGEKPEGLQNIKQEDNVKISAIWSLPRLGFTDNYRCAASIFPSLNITMYLSNGVFWDQVLTRQLEERAAAGDDWIFALDYDTIFTIDHVRRLCQLMASHPEADAIVPFQTKREDGNPMFQIVDDNGNRVLQVPIADFYDKDLMRIYTGHFGLTLFRASVFKDLKKPWFLGAPDKEGGWSEGRVDPDIYFWHNFYNSGKKVYLAPHVHIGHAQLLYSWTSSPENNWKPVHQYVSDFNKSGPPDFVKTELQKEPK